MRLDKLVKAAKVEDWDYVDKTLPKVTKNYDNVQWAYDYALLNENENVRDLGASILEKANIPQDKFNLMKERIAHHMKQDSNPYVRFRCAFAMAAHKAIDEDVLAVLNKAREDEEVASIAQSYLNNQ